jgi:pimeloyl-ACP methyl ester carboxylesterase
MTISSNTPPPVQYFKSRDGLDLAYRVMGTGRTVVLIHGYFSTATVNWIRYGHAAKIVARGYRVVMPDLRGHGDSAKPHDPTYYPHDVLADDGLALLEHLQLTDYDLGGYSLGARTTVRMLARGATPARAILGGMGLEGIFHTQGRGGYFRNILTRVGQHKAGSSEWMAEAFMKTVGGDPVALLHVLDTFADTPRATLAGIQTPTLVVCGVEDQDNGSAEELTAALPKGHYVSIPGNHMSAVTKTELGAAMAEFLAS